MTPPPAASLAEPVDQAVYPDAKREVERKGLVAERVREVVWLVRGLLRWQLKDLRAGQEQVPDCCQRGPSLSRSTPTAVLIVRWRRSCMGSVPRIRTPLGDRERKGSTPASAGRRDDPVPAACSA
jgi:hypothetical protein